MTTEAWFRSLCAFSRLSTARIHACDTPVARHGNKVAIKWTFIFAFCPKFLIFAD
jgi:hypothetical protein